MLQNSKHDGLNYYYNISVLLNKDGTVSSYGWRHHHAWKRFLELQNYLKNDATDVVDVDHHWFRFRLVAWWYLASTYSNVICHHCHICQLYHITATDISVKFHWKYNKCHYRKKKTFKCWSQNVSHIVQTSVVKRWLNIRQSTNPRWNP